jgi:lipid-binding SYLF domain-containing protein
MVSEIMLDDDANLVVYGSNSSPEQILMGRAQPPADIARDMMSVADALARYTRPMPHEDDSSW